MYYTVLYIYGFHVQPIVSKLPKLQVETATDIPETVNLKGGSSKPLAKPPKPTEFHLKVITFMDEW